MDLALFDTYNLRARFSVAVLYALPFIVDAVLLVDISNILPVTVFTLALVALSQAAMGPIRDIGKKKDIKINRAADLLAPESDLPLLTKRRYYRKLSASEPEFAPFATLLDKPDQLSKEEISALCHTVIRWLRGKTRDSKTFKMLKEENINYGFRRNLYALRMPGIFFNLAALLVLLYQEGFFTNLCLRLIMVPQIFLHLVMLLYLWRIVTEDFVNVASERYANALLDTIDLL